ILAVVGSIENYGSIALDAGEQGVEKSSDTPDERISVRVPIALPVGGSSREAVPASGMCDVLEASALERRSVEPELVRILVVHREVRADLVHENEVPDVVVDEVDERLRDAHVALPDRNPVELHERIDELQLDSVHSVLQAAAGQLTIDVYRAPSCMLRILKNRGPGAVDADVVVSRAAVTQRDVRVEAAVRDRGRDAVVQDGPAGGRLSEARSDTVVGVDVEVVGPNALVDQEYDVVPCIERGPRYFDALALANLIGEPFVCV